MPQGLGFRVRLVPQAIYMKLAVKKPGLNNTPIMSELDLSYQVRPVPLAWHGSGNAVRQWTAWPPSWQKRAGGTAPSAAPPLGLASTSQGQSCQNCREGQLPSHKRAEIAGGDGF